MAYLQNLLSSLGPLIKGAVVITAVVLAILLTRYVLNRSDQKTGGNSFRNQLIVLGGSFVGLLVIILGLPLDSTTKGQLLGLIGLLFSAAIALSSSTILGNALAGIMLKAVRNFRSGDFIRTADHFGRVTERGLFHTEIQTADRDLTTLPNLYLANTPVTVIRSSGTIIDTTVSLGYDIHHGRIEKALLKAAQAVGLADAYVQVLSLGDFSVTYRLAGLLKETKQILAYKSRLRKAVLDALHEADIEIVSPIFNNARLLDKGDAFIPRGKVSRAASARDAAPVEVVFDKAEEAESLDTLQAEREALADRLVAAQKAEKAADDPVVKAQLQAEIETLEAEQEDLLDTLQKTDDKEKADEGR